MQCGVALNLWLTTYKFWSTLLQHCSFLCHWNQIVHFWEVKIKVLNTVFTSHSTARCLCSLKSSASNGENLDFIITFACNDCITWKKELVFICISDLWKIAVPKHKESQGHPKNTLKQNTWNVVSCVLRSFCGLLKAYLYKLIQIDLFGCSSWKLKLQNVLGNGTYFPHLWVVVGFTKLLTGLFLHC